MSMQTRTCVYSSRIKVNRTEDGEITIQTCSGSGHAGWEATVDQEDIAWLIEALQKEPEPELKVGDVLFESRTYKQVVTFIADNGTVVAVDSDDGTVSKFTKEDALRSRIRTVDGIPTK